MIDNKTFKWLSVVGSRLMKNAGLPCNCRCSRSLGGPIELMWVGGHDSGCDSLKEVPREVTAEELNRICLEVEEELKNGASKGNIIMTDLTKEEFDEFCKQYPESVTKSFKWIGEVE